MARRHGLKYTHARAKSYMGNTISQADFPQAPTEARPAAACGMLHTSTNDYAVIHDLTLCKLNRVFDEFHLHSEHGQHQPHSTWLHSSQSHVLIAESMSLSLRNMWRHVPAAKSEHLSHLRPACNMVAYGSSKVLERG